MEDIFGQIAEQKIREAIRNEEFKNLPGAGKPLYVENFYFLPPEFKFAYTVLKNSGFLNLAEKKAPVFSDSDNKKSQYANPFNSPKNIPEKSSVSVASHEINSSKVMPSNSNIEKALDYNVIRDCRRRIF